MAKRLRKKSIAEEMRDRATGNNQTYTVEERKDTVIPKQDMTPTPTLQDRINKHYVENMQNLANTTMNMVTNTVKRNPIVNSFMAGFNTGKNVELPQNQVKTIQNAVKKDLQTNTQDKRNPYPLTALKKQNEQKKQEEEKHKENVSYKPYQLPQAQEMVNKNQQEADERKKNEEAQGLLSQVQNRTLPQAQKQEETKKPTLTESIQEYLRTGDIKKSAGNYFKSQFEGGKQGVIRYGQYYNEILPSKVEGDSWTKRKSEEQYKAKEYREGLLNDVKQNPNNYSKEQKSFIKNQQEFTEKYGDNFYEAYKNESKEKVNKMIEEAPTEIDRKLIEIGQSNGQSAVGAAFGMASPIVSTMYFYGSSAQSYYDSALEMGMAESDAWKYANVMGAWETVSEELITANRVDQVNKILTGSNIGKTGMKFLGNSMVENAFQEALSEPIDDITKSMLNYSYLNEGQLGERMLESGMIGAISALLMDSPTAVLSAPGDIVNLYNKSVEKIGKKATIEKMQKGAETYYAQILSEINNGLGNDAYEMMRNQNIQEENKLSRLLPGEYENQQEIDRTRDEKLKAITEDMTEGDKTAYLIQNSNLSQEEKDSLSRVARRLNVSAEQIDDLLKFNEEQKQIESENKELEQMIDNSNLSQAQIGEVLSQKSFEEAKNKINELNEENNANQEAIKTLGLNISEENKEGNISYKEKQNIVIDNSDTLESSYKKYFGENETSFVKRLKNLDKAAIESGQNVKLVFDGNYFKDDNGNIRTGVEAAFVTKDGKRIIAVNPYATTGKAFEQVLAHELTHAVLSEENADTQALYKSVQDYLTSKGEYDNIVKDLKGLYGKNYNEEEVVAKTIERLFNSKEELNSLANSNPNIFTRIYRSLVGMYAKLTGSEKAYLKKLKLDMELAWKNSNNKESLQDAAKYSMIDDIFNMSDEELKNKIQENEGKVQGLENRTKNEIKEITNDYIKQKLEENGYYSDDIEIIDSEIHGSRNRGTAREDSDLDVVVEYDGDIREDDFFNMLNDEDPLYIDGIKVDINPITADRTGTLQEYMEESNKYDKRILDKIENERKAALEGKNYKIEGKSARFTEDRLDYLIRGSMSEFSDNYARSYVTRISPEQFLNLTANNVETIERGSHELNVEELKNEPQTMFLEVDLKTGQVTGHEGRHRMVALRDAGIQNVDIEIKPNENTYNRNNAQDIDNLYLSGQRDINYNTMIHDLTAVSKKNIDKIKQEYLGNENKGDIRYSIESKKYLEEEFERLTGDSFQKAEAKLGGMALRNAQRQANNLEGELEGYPYSDEAMKLYRRIENSKSTSSYLYHSTPRDRLASILQNGLTIGNEQNQAGVSANDRLYLAATEDLAESFTPNDSITFRINPRQYNNLENFESDLLGGEGSYSITNNIPANMLQVKENGKWVNLEKSKLAKETNTNPTSNPDIRYSIEPTNKDSQGRTLTKEQQEYFKDSKVRDEDGNLLEVYHGTPTGGFTVYDNSKLGSTTGAKDSGLGIHFTNNPDMASIYKDYVSDEALNGEIKKLYEKYGKDFDPTEEFNREKVKFDREHSEEIAEIRERLYKEQEGKGEVKKQYINITKPLSVFADYGIDNKQLADDWVYALTGSTDITDTTDYYEDNEEFLDAIQSNWNNELAEAKDELATPEAKERLQELGYDGLILPLQNTDVAGLAALKTQGGEEFKDIQLDGNEYIVFNSNQAKNIDNLNPSDNPDIRYSIETINKDSQGRELSEGQKKFFANEDTKLLDKNGNLKVLYHGTPYGKFYEFNDKNMYFLTEDYQFAEDYAYQKSFEQEIDGEANVMEVYAKAEKVFDPSDENDIEALRKVLPEKLQYWGTEFDKETALDRIQRKDVLPPKWTKEQIDKAEFGRVIGEDRYGFNNDLFIGVNNNNEVVYVTHDNYRAFENMTEKEKQDVKSKLMNGETVYFDYYSTPFGYMSYNALIDKINEYKQKGHELDAKHLQETKDAIDNHQTWKYQEVSSKINPYTDSLNETQLNDIDNWSYIETLFDKESGKDVFQYIKDLGYDAINLFEKGKSNYVVFNKNQIKDVTNQNPTENPDIRYSETTETADEILDRLLEKYRGKGERTYLPGIPKNLPKDYIMELGNKIEQMSIPDDRKLELYNLANTNDWNEESYNNFMTDLDAIEQEYQAEQEQLKQAEQEKEQRIKQAEQEKQQRNRFTTKVYNDPDRAELIIRKRNEFNKDYHYNDKLVDEIDSLLPRNNNGNRLVREWKNFARELGKRLAIDNYTPDEVEDIAVKSYYDLLPTRNLTTYDKDSLSKKAPREKLYANDWVNSVYEGLNEAGYDVTKFSITDNGQNVETGEQRNNENLNKMQQIAKEYIKFREIGEQAKEGKITDEEFLKEPYSDNVRNMLKALGYSNKEAEDIIASLADLNGKDLNPKNIERIINLHSFSDVMEREKYRAEIIREREEEQAKLPGQPILPKQELSNKLPVGQVNESKEDSLNPTEIANLKLEDASTTPILPDKKYKKGDKQSQFVSNINDKVGFLTDEEKQAITSDENVQYYASVTNAETMAKAYKDLQENGRAETESWYAKKSEEATAEDVAKGWILLKQYKDSGNTQGMVNVAKKLRDMGSKAGQTVQAFNIMSRLTPEGMVAYTQGELQDAYNEMIKGKTKKWIDQHKGDFDLSQEEVAFIMDTMQNLPPENPDTNNYERKVALGQIQKLFTDKIPADGNGIKAWMRISMLFNPKTQVRNVAGNAAVIPVNMFSDFLGSKADKLISKYTGLRTLGNPNVKSYLKGMKDGFYQSYNDFRLGINTRDLENNKFEFGDGKAFKNKGIGKALNRVDNILNFVMDFGDRGFSQAAFVNSINNQMVLNNVTQPTQEMIDIATNEALSRTWNDSNDYTRLVLSIRSALNKVGTKNYGLGDVLIPFAKTPANLTKAIVDYSPVGLTKSILNIKGLKNAIETGQITPKMQHEFVDRLGKGLAGSLLYVAGYALAKAGITSGEPDDDKDVKNFMRNSLGIAPYSIKIGDKTFTYDWSQPIATPLAIMANYEKMSKDNPDAKMIDKVLGAVDIGTNQLLEQSFMESINEVLNGNGTVTERIQQAIFDLPARAIPTFSKQVADLVDGTQRTTFEYGNPTQSAINSAKAKLPGLSKTLTPSIDTLGNEIQKYGGENNWFNVFFNPANMNKGEKTKAGQEIYDVYMATGDTTVFPVTAPYYVNRDGGKITMDSKQRARYQKISGDYTEQAINKLLNDPDYNKLKADDKAEIISKVVTDSKERANKDVLNITNKSSDLDVIDKVGADYYTFKLSTKGMKEDVEMDKVLKNKSYSNKNKQELYESEINSKDKAFGGLKQINSNFDMDSYLDYKINIGTFKGDDKKDQILDYLSGLDMNYDEKLYLYGQNYKLNTSELQDLENELLSKMTTEQAQEVLNTLRYNK